MKKSVLVGLVIAALSSACSADVATPTKPTTQTNQLPAYDNPYQDVFNAVSPIMNVDSKHIKTENLTWVRHLDFGDPKEITVSGFALENPAANINITPRLENALLALGWQKDQDLSADGVDGSQAGYTKGKHLCFIWANYNEKASGMSLDEWLEYGNEVDDTKIKYSIKVACATNP